LLKMQIKKFFSYCYLKPTLCCTQYKHKKVNTLFMKMNLLAWVAREDILNEIQNRFSEVAPFILDYNYTVSEKLKLAVAQSIHQFHLQGKTISRHHMQLYTGETKTAKNKRC